MKNPLEAIRGDHRVWEREDVVEWFASRPPDTRLQQLLNGAPSSTAVLDLGCAGGRNAVWIASQGFDVHALDASSAMVEKTRSRLAEHVGEAEATRRTHHGSMDDLSRFPDGRFDLIVAMGIFHAARTEAEWHAAVAESARVLRSGGEILVAHFSPDADPRGEGIHLWPGEAHVYRAFSGHERTLLLDPQRLDTWFAEHGFAPSTPTTAVRVTTDTGFRTTVNARYRKRVAREE